MKRRAAKTRSSKRRSHQDLVNQGAGHGQQEEDQNDNLHDRRRRDDEQLEQERAQDGERVHDRVVQDHRRPFANVGRPPPVIMMVNSTIGGAG